MANLAAVLNDSPPHQDQDVEKSSPALVSDMLTAAHLKYAQYDYSLSTFLTEANLLSTTSLTWAEWLRLLGVSSTSSLAVALSQRKIVDQTSPLEMFLDGVVKSCGRSNEHAGKNPC